MSRLVPQCLDVDRGSSPMWRTALSVATGWCLLVTASPPPTWGSTDPWLMVHSRGPIELWRYGGLQPPYIVRSYDVVRQITIRRDGSVVGSETETEPTVAGPVVRSSTFAGHLLDAERTRLVAALAAASPLVTGGCDPRRTRFPDGPAAQNRVTHETSEIVSAFGPSGQSDSFFEADAGVPCDDSTLSLLSVIDGVADRLGALASASLPCDAGSDAFTLAGGRFRFDICWATAQASGHGKLAAEHAEGATVWFFAPTNPELFVKVKNACVSPYQRYWVFVTGLTNVAVAVTVTDLATGTTTTYDNRQTSPFVPILDTATFDVCP